MKKEDLSIFFSRLKETFPNPKSELEFVNQYTLMVSIILSAQATDKGVNKATAALYAKVKTAEEMLSLGEEGLKTYIKSLNYYNTKAHHIIEMSKVLLEKFNGKFPNNLEDLQLLPGVGRKTANVFLNVAYDAPLIAVDTHVFRVSNRLKIALGKTPLEVEEGLKKVVPEDYKPIAQHLLVLFGRYICKATKPNCKDCPVYEICPWKEKKNFLETIKSSQKRIKVK